MNVLHNTPDTLVIEQGASVLRGVFLSAGLLFGGLGLNLLLDGVWFGLAIVGFIGLPMLGVWFILNLHVRVSLNALTETAELVTKTNRGTDAQSWELDDLREAVVETHPSQSHLSRPVLLIHGATPTRVVLIEAYEIGSRPRRMAEAINGWLQDWRAAAT